MSEPSDIVWISSVNGPFWVRSASVTCLCIRNFVTSAIAFLITVACYAINSAGGSMCVIRGKAPNTKSVDTMLL
jgi:hypothetical protein